MVVPSSSVTTERLRDENGELCRSFVVINKFQLLVVKLDTRVNIYVRKWRLLLVLNQTKQTIKKIKR